MVRPRARLAIKAFNVLALEQAQEFGEFGAGIQLAPNASSASTRSAWASGSNRNRCS